MGDKFVTSNIDEMLLHSLDGQNATKLRSSSSLCRQLARCGPNKIAYWAYDPKLGSYVARRFRSSRMVLKVRAGHFGKNEVSESCFVSSCRGQGRFLGRACSCHQCAPGEVGFEVAQTATWHPGILLKYPTPALSGHFNLQDRLGKIFRDISELKPPGLVRPSGVL